MFHVKSRRLIIINEVTISLIIAFLKIFSLFLLPILLILLKIRVEKNKEYSIRYREKLGIYSHRSDVLSLKDLNIKIIWVHAASIGEMNSAKKLIVDLSANYFVVLTTTTLTSSKVFENWNVNKKNIVHVFAPLDISLIFNRFYNQFRPFHVIFIESEIWPMIILSGFSKIRGCKILASARISYRSINSWSKCRYLFRKMMHKFDIIYPSSEHMRDILRNDFNIQNANNLGSLKFDFIKQERDENITHIITNKLSLNYSDNVICFVSVHRSEFKTISTIVNVLLQNNMKVIVIPRHVEHSTELQSSIDKSSLLSDDNTSVNCLIINEFGVVFTCLYISKICIMCGSFMENIGGHNVLEAASAGIAIYTGLFHENHKDIIDKMHQINAIKIFNHNDGNTKIANEILALSQDEDSMNQMSQNALNYYNNGKDFYKTIALYLNKYEKYAQNA